MKFSLNLALYYSSVDIVGIGKDKLIDKIGAQLGAIDEVIDIEAVYSGITVSKIVSCVKHPDADKLSLCWVDDGGAVTDVERNNDGHVQVVCGAPNAKVGLMVAWIPPGSTVPESFSKEPFVLEKREIRGKVSNGMIASPKELGLGDNHSGILEIDEDIKPGTSFADAFGLKNDIIIDIENKMFTHRPDCFGFLGITRELAGIQGLQFTSPDWYKTDPIFPKNEVKELKLDVINELSELVPRFCAIAMSEVKVGPSPVWLQVSLAKIGQKSINNIVDYTNYFMQLTGQPLHAYDYDKVKSLSSGDKATLLVRYPKKGEKIALLNGKTMEPRDKAIMIATDKQAIGIGGVMGGTETEVDENTTRIILECANFDMYSIRRTSMAHGLFTDAVTRFNKGQSQLQNLAVLAKIVDEIRQFAGGKVASSLIDESFVDTGERSVSVSVQFVNDRLGLNLSGNEMKQLLKNVEFWVGDSEDDLKVIVPFWRTDIHIPEDIVEEIGRLYGYDKLPLELPFRNLRPAPLNPLIELKDSLRNILAKAGANEVLTYSFVHGELLKKASQDVNNAYQLSNALSPDLQYYRMSLVPSILGKVHSNIKSGYSQFALFEINQVHNKDLVDEDKLPIEEHRLALILAAADKTANAKYSGAAYYQAKHYADLILEELHIDHIFELVQDEPTMAVGKQAIAPFDKTRRAVIKTADGELLGEIGEFKPSVQKNFKLPSYSAGFELDIERLLKFKQTRKYVPIPKFPSVEQDITLKVPANVAFADIDQLIRKELLDIAPKERFTLTPLAIYQPENDKQNLHFSWRLNIASYEKTLVAGEVNKLLDEVSASANAAHGAVRV